MWLLFAVLGLAVVYPFVAKGWLLLLDWSQGPHVVVPRSFWGLDEGAIGGSALQVILLAADWVLGAARTSWLIIAVVFPLAGVGMSRLVGGRPVSRIVAGLVFALSPIVYERVWAGQVAFLIAYALLPWAAKSVLDAPARRGPARLIPVLWIVLLMAFATHFAFIAGLLLVGVVLRDRLTRRTLAWAAVVLVALGLSSAYLLVGATGRPGTPQVTTRDLAVYRTTPDEHLGLYVNVAAMYGFWRQEPVLPKDDIVGWPFLLAGMLLLGAAGVRAALGDERRRRAVVPLLFAAGAGYLLALGDQGPTGPLFRWMFLNVPGFAIMREPQKFAALLALAYAFFIGAGAEAVLERTSGRHARTAVAAIVLILPVAYNPSLFGGLRHRLSVSRYPAAWFEADRLMGSGPGKVLFLPWHEYMAYPFTDRRVINTPASRVFHRDVISGDNVEVAGISSSVNRDRSRYLQFLFQSGPSIHSFGQLVAPTGVQFVAVAKTVDWESYGWLNHQSDLTVVLDTPALVVYRNGAADPAGGGRRLSSLPQVEDWGDLVAQTETGRLAGTPVVARHEGPGPIDARAPVPTGDPPQVQVGAPVRPASPVRWSVPPGSEPITVIPEPFDPEWRLGSSRPIATAQGTMAFESASRSGSVRFTLWRRILVGYALSAVIVLALAASCIIARCRRNLDADEADGKAAPVVFKSG